MEEVINVTRCEVLSEAHNIFWLTGDFNISKSTWILISDRMKVENAVHKQIQPVFTPKRIAWRGNLSTVFLSSGTGSSLQVSRASTRYFGGRGM